MKNFDINKDPHRRYNPLINEWVLVSPQRAKKSRQEQSETILSEPLLKHDPKCYLCSGNTRQNGIINPKYENNFVFENDFSTLKQEEVMYEDDIKQTFFKAKPERGISKMVSFSPRHDLTLAEMPIDAIENLIRIWQKEYAELGAIKHINYVQIFENKGNMMGTSNPHPHGQIWAQSSLPTQVEKMQQSLSSYFNKNNRTLLQDYLRDELRKGDRIILENDHFVALIPFWAIWPYETMIISTRHITKITDFTPEEIHAYAIILKQLTTKYDNLFKTSFPYSSGIYQAPTDGGEHLEWHFHMHFYPPLLHSAIAKKHLVGYEMLENHNEIFLQKKAQKF